jgi:putative tryptophan/tyrosine transport system substrate-binding protein
MVKNLRGYAGRRLGGTVLTLLVLISLLLSGCAAEKPKVYRVGVLSGLEYVADITDGFKARMTELGYVEGQNVIYDVQKTDFDMAAYNNILKKFVTDKVDVIVAFPTEASIEAKMVTEGSGIPVVFTFALIEGMGLVDSVRQPGGNTTGVRYPGPDIALKRFEIMRQLAPDAKRYLLPYQKGYPIVAGQLEALVPAAEAAGIILIEAPADNAADLDAQLSAMAVGEDPGFDAILMLVEPLAVTPDAFEVMGKYAYENKVPLGGALFATNDYRTVFGVNVNTFEVGKITAPLVDKIFKGANAGTVPVVSAESILQIDTLGAAALGVVIPDGLLLQANEVVR